MKGVNCDSRLKGDIWFSVVTQRVQDMQSDEWQSAWPPLVQDAGLIIHYANIPLTGPTEPDQAITERTPVILDEKNGIFLNGVGDDGHEDFYISKIGNNFSFCKTGRRPYDLVVCTILLRAYVLAPSTFELSSDGDWDNDWVEARDLYHCIWPEENIPCPWEKE
ncbi:hypothetical protein AFLA70_31g005050 [Aspergillus flavus AF70]|nr:hypothetical protein AFLA70_31g005050 [Aspergillus flavus AF70]